MDRNGKKHFVLVHGFCHGAWCWYKLVVKLKRYGHKVTALDLGGCGIHPKQLNEMSSIADYLQPLMDFMATLLPDESVVLVGHSYGGIPISLAMENFPGKISVAVYISAYMPNSGDPPSSLIQEFFTRVSLESLMDCQLKIDEGSGNLPISATLGPEYMAAKVYQHCVLEDQELAKMLIRPNMFFMEDLSKNSLQTQEKYGSIRRVYIICEGDQVMEEEFQRYVIEKSPPKEVKSIAEAGHMIMLSKPDELCRCLQEIAEKYH